MKKSSLIVIAITLCFLQSIAFAQDKDKLIYYVGVGPTIDGNGGLLGVNISNELSFALGKRSSLNPSLTYYQSIGYWDEDERNKKR